MTWGWGNCCSYSAPVVPIFKLESVHLHPLLPVLLSLCEKTGSLIAPYEAAALIYWHQYAVEYALGWSEEAVKHILYLSPPLSKQQLCCLTRTFFCLKNVVTGLKELSIYLQCWSSGPSSIHRSVAKRRKMAKYSSSVCWEEMFPIP